MESGGKSKVKWSKMSININSGGINPLKRAATLSAYVKHINDVDEISHQQHRDNFINSPFAAGLS